jgi:tetratricopeptide (TPR) repeat protein
MSRAWLALAVVIAMIGSVDASGSIASSARQAPSLADRRPGGADDAAAVVSEASRAVESGHAAEARARYAARLARDGTDRAALLGAATVARLSYDFDGAYEQYHRLFDGVPITDRIAIAARLGLAMAMEAHGKKPGLEALLDSAREGARRAGDRATEGAAHFWLAATLVRLHGGGFGLAHLDSALRLLPPEEHEVRDLSRCRRAQIMGVMGSAGARDSLANALVAAQSDRVAAAQAICWRALGTYHWIHGANDSSLAAYDSAAALHARVRDGGAVAVDLTQRADAMRTQGDVGGSTRVFRQALAEARASRNLYIQATVTLGLGGTSLTLNDHATAKEQVNEAVRAFDAASDSAGAIMARSFLPFISLAAGDYALARRQLAEVMPWAQRVGEWTHVEELYTQLADIEMRAGNWAAAERALEDARVTSRKLGPKEDQALASSRGKLALYRGDLASARREFSSYLAGLDTSQHIQRYETRAYLADLSARTGDLAAAERELKAAGVELDAWRKGLADADLRTLVFQAGVSESNDRNASVARVLAALAAGGRADAALALAEGRRARELSDRLTQLAALRDASAAPTSQRNARSGDAVLGSAPPVATPPNGSTAVIEYVTGAFGAPTTVFVETQTSGGIHVSAHVLAAADSLVADIARFDALVEAGDSATTLARSLGARLLDSALADVGPVERIVIVPDGPLHRVPWDALRTADGHYVVERFAVTLAPSLRTLAELRNRPARTHTSRLLAYGDPAFASGTASRQTRESASEAERYRSAFDSAGGLPRLEASAREAALVARYADDAEVRTGDRATAAFLKHAPLDQFRVLHFATHAIVDDRVVTRTSLAVAPGEGESGFLGPSDLAALPLDADLVVLSACRSAGGVVVDGEGVQGLTAPLLQAGARAVVATQWRIGDRSTVAFVDDFYRAMAEGRPVGDALRAAKLAALRRGAPAREWAAFTVIGDPLVLPSLHAPSRWRAWWLALAAVVAALVVDGAATRRRPRVERA